MHRCGVARENDEDAGWLSKADVMPRTNRLFAYCSYRSSSIFEMGVEQQIRTLPFTGWSSGSGA